MCPSETSTSRLCIVTLTLELLLELREEYSKKRFGEIVGGALQREGSVDGMNPIETVTPTQVFQLNLRDSLAKFDQYYDELKRKHDSIKNKLRAQGLIDQIRLSDQEFQRSVDMIAEAYDRHMKEMAPSPELLPLRVILKVPTRNIYLDIHVPRTHTCSDLRNRIIEYYTAAGNEVEEFLAGGRFIIQGPLAKAGEESVAEELDQIRIIEDESEPLGKLHIAQGSIVLYDGTLRLRSDAPKACFTLRYQDGVACNYFTCRTCNMNCEIYTGVCEACVEGCHQGHQTILSIADHKPTWACCYCPKKGKCKIPNSRSK